jgi:hypothetical protein
MDAGARRYRRDAEAEHHRGPREAIRHADRAIDQLRGEADSNEQDEIPDHRCPSGKQSCGRFGMTDGVRRGVRAAPAMPPGAHVLTPDSLMAVVRGE